MAFIKPKDGIKITAEEYAQLRKSISKAQKNFYSNPLNREAAYKHSTTKKAVYCLTSKKVFDSVSAAARYYNITPTSAISSAITHKCRAGGYYWCYNLEDEIRELKEYLKGYVFKKHRHKMSAETIQAKITILS